MEKAKELEAELYDKAMELFYGESFSRTLELKIPTSVANDIIYESMLITIEHVLMLKCFPQEEKELYQEVKELIESRL